MLQAIRRRMSPATALGVLALVLAMTGGAYAAGRYVITSTKQIKPSVLKQLHGNAGAHGVSGAVGPAGAVGAAGAPGAAGKEGAPGKEGPAGQPWVPNNTLPSGAEETGVWGMSQLAKTPSLFSVHIPISFPIPLAVSLDETHVHIIAEEETGVAKGGCGGGSSEEPTAEPGNLCVYIASANNVTPASFSLQNVEKAETGAGKTGADLEGLSLAEGASARGEWVVHAE